MALAHGDAPDGAERIAARWAEQKAALARALALPASAISDVLADMVSIIGVGAVRHVYPPRAMSCSASTTQSIDGAA